MQLLYLPRVAYIPSPPAMQWGFMKSFKGSKMNILFLSYSQHEKRTHFRFIKSCSLGFLT